MALINHLASHWRHLISLTGALSVVGTVASYVLVVMFAATLFAEPASAQHPFKLCTNVEPDPSDPSSMAINKCYVETRVCNEGEIDVYVVHAVPGGNNSSSTHTSHGWYSVKRNECVLVSYDWVFHLGFLAAENQSGFLLDKGKGEIVYDDTSVWFSSGKAEGSEWGNNENAFICVPEDFSGPFNTTFRTWNYDAACEKGFMRFPLSNWVTPYERNRWNHIDLKIKPMKSHTRPVASYESSEGNNAKSSSDITETDSSETPVLDSISDFINEVCRDGACTPNPDRFQVAEYDDGSRYWGQIRDNRRNGLGEYTSPNGFRYEGGWKDNKMDGSGVATFANGDKYDGEWKDNNQHGRGLVIWSNGNQYDGEWKDNKQDGRGVYTWPNGNKYDGEWKDNIRDGHGVFTLGNDNICEGEWSEGKLVGTGEGVTNGVEKPCYPQEGMIFTFEQP